MKKFFYLTAIAALSFAACTKETNTSDEAVQGQAEKAYNFYFSASAPTPQEEDGSKTTLGNSGAVQWEAGDVIDIWYLDSESNPAKVEGTALSTGASTTFGVTLPDGAAPDHFWAAYPAGSGTLTNEGSESFTITVDATDGSFKSANFMAAYSTSTAKSFAFKNAVGIVRLQLPSGGVISHNGKDYTISTIRLKGKETSIRSRGDAVVNIEGGVVSGYIFPTSGGQQNASVTLSDAARSSGYAYIPSFPGTLTNGFGVRYYSEEGNIPGIITKNTPVTITAGNIKPLSDLTPRIVWDYYVSADGSGDGLSSSTPMSLASFKTMLDNGNSFTVYANYLNGTTIHFAAGDYAIANELYFDFPDATEMTIDGNGAVLDGGGASRIIRITTDVKMAISNLTFTNAELTGSEQGGAVSINYKKTDVAFSGCTFSNNSAANAGAVLLKGTSDSTDDTFKASFTDCLFSANTANSANTNTVSSPTGGGAIVVGQTTAGGLITFNNCRFDKNVANQGTSLYTTAPVASFFNGCTFYQDKAPILSNSAINGYAIYSSNEEGRLGMNNCTMQALNSDSQSNNTNNGTLIRSSGYGVIANTTVWNSKQLAKRASVFIGRGSPAGTVHDPNDNIIVNSMIHQKSTNYNALFFNNNYYLSVLHSLFDGINGTQADGHQFVENCHNYGEKNGGAPAGADNKTNQDHNGIKHNYYTWTFTGTQYPDYTPATLGYVKAAIRNTNGIGELFYNWLDEIGALDKDIMGRSRGSSDSDLQCPGSYHQTWAQ